MDEKTYIVDRLEPMYWEGQKGIEMDDKNEDHHDKLVFMVHVPINEKSMSHVTKFFMEMDFDEHCLDSVTCGNKMCSVLNHKTLTNKAIH